MPDRRFFAHAGPFSLSSLAALSGIEIDPALEREIERAAPLVRSDERSVSFFSDRRYLDDLKATRAAAVFVAPAFRESVPEGTAAIVTPEAQPAWARAAARLHPVRELDNETCVHPTAVLEEEVRLGPNAVIGAEARIGRGTRIGANSVIGPGVQIGRDCRIGPNVSVSCALIGDGVTVLAGAVIGESGFGIAGGRSGIVEIPQLGRVILQDRVLVGAGTCIDRGAFDDTVLGEDTKIDNLCQIAHGVVMGRGCFMASQTGISGSSRIGDGVLFGGQAGVADHVTVASGARIGGKAGIVKDIPPGETWSGYPAKPIRQWLRETAWLAKQASSRDEGDKHE